MGHSYELSCRHCFTVQTFSTSGTAFQLMTNREILLDSISSEAKTELKKIEKEFPCKEEDIAIHTNINKCFCCKKLSTQDVFTIKLTKNFNLLLSHPWCKDCECRVYEFSYYNELEKIFEKNLKQIDEDSAFYQWLENSFCSSCGKIGLSLDKVFLLD